MAKFSAPANVVCDPPVTFKFEQKSALDSLESAEQRALLDVVADMRKCGLEGIIDLPQIVVCGDQSSGKSSVLEALTEIPFPRNDNLCTRYATEISLRKGPLDSLLIKIIPGSERNAEEQNHLKKFRRTITDFDNLPEVMNDATAAMGIGATDGTSQAAFARDVLSIEIEGPNRPQLTVIDIPGLVQSETDGVTKADLLVVEQITDHYIKQPRTINLAVISASNDYACQQIITKVRAVDPTGSRTLGVITKPDKLDSGSDSEKAYIKLARNKDVKFALGWHVIKNRSFKDKDCDLAVRNSAETAFFNTSNFSVLPSDHLGIGNLRNRLGTLLYAHLRREIPNLRKDLDAALQKANTQLKALGPARCSGTECKHYLTRLSMEFLDSCKAAVNGSYEGAYFAIDHSQKIQEAGVINPRRLRAVIQAMNTAFSADFRSRGHRYHFEILDDPIQGPKEPGDEDKDTKDHEVDEDESLTDWPESMDAETTMRWIGNALAATRGRELGGNYNPLIIGELFWLQSERWETLAANHLQAVSDTCRLFLHDLLKHVCPTDLVGRVWTHTFLDSLDARQEAAEKELTAILEDVKEYPTSYTTEYAKAILELREKRSAQQEDPSSPKNLRYDDLSLTDVLDCLVSIYKVKQKVFIDNITTQVVERHIIRGMERIFSPLSINEMSENVAQAVVAEPDSTTRSRHDLETRCAKLKDGRSKFSHNIDYTAASSMRSARS